MSGASVWLTARSTSRSRPSGACGQSQRPPAAIFGILVDLPGPKVRCKPFPEGGCNVTEDAVISLAIDGDASTADRLVVDYEGLLTDVGPGDRLSFGDGNVVLYVEDRASNALKTRVLHGGHLEGRPGLHIDSSKLRMSTPTPHDLKLADTFVDLGTDMVAVSFVRSAHDMRRLGVEPHPRGPLLVAKVETKAAVENLEGIIEASSAVMVARGDLGAECDIEELPHLQKRIIEGLHRARTSRHHRHADARIAAAFARCRPAQRRPTSPTPSSTAPRR